MSALLVIAGLLMVMVAIGVGADVVQFVITWATFRKPPAEAKAQLGISILKPLCGADDDLEENLRQFATLPYPNYELILGVKNDRDPAYPLAVAAVKRWPNRVKLALQRGEPGLNPKVNQLCTMVELATKEIVLVSDSNCRAPEGYLEEIAGIFESDPQVACVSNPIIGIGEQKLGSLLDNLYVATVVTTGVVAAKFAKRDIVVGKSMALRRTDLDRMGGFYGARNHLAEDYVLGKKVAELGKKVFIARRPVYQVSQNKTFREFLDRHRRWAIIHRTAIAPITYLGQGAMNFLPLTVLALVIYPSRPTLLTFAGGWALKTLLDWGALRIHRGAFGLKTPFYVLMKDCAIFLAWCNGVFRRTVVWRGNRLRVEHGSLLRRPDALEEAIELDVPLDQPLPAPRPVGVMAPAVRWTPSHHEGERPRA